MYLSQSLSHTVSSEEDDNPVYFLGSTSHVDMKERLEGDVLTLTLYVRQSVFHANANEKVLLLPSVGGPQQVVIFSHSRSKRLYCVGEMEPLFTLELRMISEGRNVGR